VVVAFDMGAAGPIPLDWTSRLFAGTAIPAGCAAPT
jgi:hypothetical protein